MSVYVRIAQSSVLCLINRLENMTTTLLESLIATPSWDSLPFALDIIRNVTASMVQSMQAQTGRTCEQSQNVTYRTHKHNVPL